MLSEPNCDSPANIDASVMFRDHRDLYNKKVKELVIKSMDF